MSLKSIKTILPFAILFFLLILLWRELFATDSHELPSPLIGETLPHFSLPNLGEPHVKLTPDDLKGHVSLLNVWATWCYACGTEHAMLMKISHQYHVPIYGIDYKDNHEDAVRWLTEKGNPYQKIGDDRNGDAAIDLGVYGTPETFVINPQGKIVYRQVGAINQATWDNILYPIIQQYEGTPHE
ncbi:MAG: hypothetical protein A3E85_01700 [Gammaproteobacteria bacterium RIFCSPHIGHO2_12_FULL_45_12]|nr:MAG: hypothetical protein A3E85_01700 [Gammaproteobacteria bacterium RIFCSPHIGHO2_12_FULL_45_12]